MANKNLLIGAAVAVIILASLLFLTTVQHPASSASPTVQNGSTITSSSQQDAPIHQLAGFTNVSQTQDYNLTSSANVSGSP